MTQNEFNEQFNNRFLIQAEALDYMLDEIKIIRNIFKEKG